MALNGFLNDLMADLRKIPSDISIVSDNASVSPNSRQRAKLSVTAALLGKRCNSNRRLCRWASTTAQQRLSASDSSLLNYEDDDHVERRHSAFLASTKTRTRNNTSSSSSSSNSAVIRKSKSDTFLSVPTRKVSPKITKQYFCPPKNSIEATNTSSQNETWENIYDTSTSKICKAPPSLPKRRGSITPNVYSNPDMLMSRISHEKTNSTPNCIDNKNLCSSHTRKNSTEKSKNLLNLLGSMAPQPTKRKTSTSKRRDDHKDTLSPGENSLSSRSLLSPTCSSPPILTGPFSMMNDSLTWEPINT